MIYTRLDNKILLLFSLLLLTSSVVGQNRWKKKATVEIQLQHFVGEQPLQLDSQKYINGLGQEFNVSKFKYYIGNIHLKKENGFEFVSSQYFLIDEDDTCSKRLVLENVPIGEYTSLSFTLGVDSTHNCSGAQSGALDPIHGMFWTWNTGYIFLKMEGNSNNSPSPGGLIEYHIGGYKQPSNSIRNISLTLAAPFITAARELASLEMNVDVLEILKDPNPIDFAKLPAVTDFRNATLIADNYSKMFKIVIKQNEK